MSNTPLTPSDDLEGALEALVSKHAILQDFCVNQPTTYHNVHSLLEQYQLRVENLNAINIQREKEIKAKAEDFTASIVREAKMFDENERLGAALATVKNLLELITGIRDTHPEREAQLTLVTRFITDALNPISEDDYSDIPF